MNSDQLRRQLAKQGCTFEAGKGGHLIVRHGDKVSVLPQHGGRKQLGTGLVNAILKQLDLK
jgi:mRNA interferase HicA